MASPHPNPKLIKTLGSEENGLTIVPPRAAEAAVDILHEVNTLMHKRRTRNKLHKWIESEQDNSCRAIQGGRFEIFLDANRKSTAFFDQVLAKYLPAGAKDTILQYARRQAQRDSRLHGHDYKFGNFSLIVSFEHVDAQAPQLRCVPSLS